MIGDNVVFDDERRVVSIECCQWEGGPRESEAKSDLLVNRAHVFRMERMSFPHGHVLHPWICTGGAT